MNRYIAIVIATLMLLASPTMATRHHSSSTRTHSTVTTHHRKKTEFVSGYTTKNGKHVKAYKRRPRK